ncbi:MAG TPA: hypothetical protein PKE19_00225 [Aestuariivirga sp.]|nr:hypothetical protein [Aestuariivirga sp.]
MTVDPFYIDPRCKEWATPAQAKAIDAFTEVGSIRGAAKKLGKHHKTVASLLSRAKEQAALHGWAPGADMVNPVPAPFVVKGVSTYYGKDGNPVGQWVKSRIGDGEQWRVLQEWVDGLKEDARGVLKPVKAPKACNDDLLSAYVIGDPHFGLYSWGEETGADFDLSEAERLTKAAIDRLVDASPSSSEGLIVELGDLLHADNSTNMTPTSGNVLDVDTRHAKVMRSALGSLRYAISRTLSKHERVTVWIVGGNHDPHSSKAVAMVLEAAYENEPRVTIDTGQGIFKFFRFGKSLISAHHGHNIKPDQLPLLMAHDRPEDWAASIFRYWYCGHVHHVQRKEFPGCIVEHFRTLAARDAWHTSMGYRAGRDMTLIIHHREYGEIERKRADIAMLTGVAA